MTSFRVIDPWVYDEPDGDAPAGNLHAGGGTTGDGTPRNGAIGYRATGHRAATGPGPAGAVAERPPAHRVIERRSNRLGRGLVSIGVRSGDTVVVLCCDHHRTDRLVACVGIEKAGAVPLVLPLLPPEELREVLRAQPPSRILACAEGVAAWRRAGVGCRVVGDAPDVTWWKLLEARHSPAPFPLPDAGVTS